MSVMKDYRKRIDWSKEVNPEPIPEKTVIVVGAILLVFAMFFLGWLDVV